MNDSENTIEKMTEEAIAASVADEKVRDWSGGLSKKSVQLNWKPVWKIFKNAPKFLKVVAGNLSTSPVWNTADGGFMIDFSRVFDEKMLKTLSDICERDYLDTIDAARQEWLQKAAAEKRSADAALIDFERYLCKTDLYYLGKYVLGYDKAVFHLHKFMCETMENLKPGYRGLREFPRDSFKSTFMVISFMVQEVLKNPNIHILLKSNNEGNASKKLLEAKAHFRKGKTLAILFPEHVPQKASEEGSGSIWTTPASTGVQAEGTFNSAGVGTSKTSQHYDIIIGDDFWDAKSVKSAEVMSNVRDEMAEIEYLLAIPAEGQIVFVGTRFALDDPSTQLIENPEYVCVIASGILKSGRSIFPEQLTLRKFYAQAHTNLYVFSCQIMLNPTREDQGFDAAWFQEMYLADLKISASKGEISYTTVILTDPAGTATSGSDNIAILVVLKDSKKRYTAVEYIRRKMSPFDFMNTLFVLWDKWHPEFIVRQKAPLEAAMSSFIQDKNRQRLEKGETAIRFYDLSLGKNSKEARMEALQPYFQKGQVYFDPNIPTMKELKKEILSFPYDMSNDDGMDALSEICDPVVSRCPTLGARQEEQPDKYVPTSETVRQAESSWRQQQAREYHNKMKHPVPVLERPGMVAA
ncbi:MAG TPA: hypothetical protein DCZ94_21620 [Lentisphaeria bacterium]|nr:MAG: hypothetical protein A2X48_14550 [Lentisphaerae bacterium GWF2_49_21]HBC89545.1 hypothetical protein [Lentisphaeria bacterium]